jgi:uncharacterized protein YgbK (DUF1537 family)
MRQRCLVIADDLTGAADAGAQFAKRGLDTRLISCKDRSKIDFSRYIHQDVLVVNTDSRGLSPDEASSLISDVLKNYKKDLFPILYKMDGVLCFMAPSYPEQDRRLVGGIMIVGEKPLALTEVAMSTTLPIRESHVHKLLQQQSQTSIGWIDLTLVASNFKCLQEKVEKEEKRGIRLIIFDAVSRQDLTNVTEVGFSLKKKPLFVGSAGLAEEVAKKISPPEGTPLVTSKQVVKPFKHILIISGTASSVTHQQLRRIEQRGIPTYQLSKTLLVGDDVRVDAERKEISKKISDSLSQGMVILKTTPEMLQPENSADLPIYLKIVETLSDVALSSLERSKVEMHELALILTGGDTAQSIINALGNEGIEIEGELLKGIVKGHLIGGNWDGLNIITKAGAFGKENALEKIIGMLQTEKGEARNN